MPGSVVLPYYTSRGTISYNPADFFAEKNCSARLPAPPCRPRQRPPHSIHINRLPAGLISPDLQPQPPAPEPKKPSRYRLALRKLASRENAKRVLGSVFSPFSSNTSSASSSAASSASTDPGRPETLDSPISPWSSLASSPSITSGVPSTILARRIASATTVAETTMSRTPFADSIRSISPKSSISAISTRSTKSTEGDKPVCAGNGIWCKLILAEPVIFLTGLDNGTTRDSSGVTCSILRGKMQLNVTKSAKIKAVALEFKGCIKMEWPEGIPPETSKKKTVEDTVGKQGRTFYKAEEDASESSYGTDTYTLRDDNRTNSSATNLSSSSIDSPTSQSNFTLPIIGNRSSRSSTLFSSKDQKGLSLNTAHSRSFQKGESPFGPTPQQKGYKVFPPGVYEYGFEIPIHNRCPESIKVPHASLIWKLEVIVQRAGTFKPNLKGFKEIPVIRSPSVDSLQLSDPISISRTWEEQLHYDILISGKCFPLGSKIPIAFKLTPLAKVQVHKLKIYVNETVEYHARDKNFSRRDPTRKIMLLEKIAGLPLAKEYESSEIRILMGGEPSPTERAERREAAVRQRSLEARANNRDPNPLPEVTENMLGDIDLGLEQFLGQTEMEMNVQLPTCEMMKKDRTKWMTYNCSWKNVDVHHWIKIAMRISRLDPDDPTGKTRRHFEVSVDSPICILNCRATQANISLPEYSGLDESQQSRQRVCGCPNAAMVDNSPASSTENVPIVEDMHGFGPERTNALPDLQRPPQAHLSNNAAVQRPIHMLRAPSFNPPAFDADEPPPPIATPPPLYDNVIGTPSHDGLADYFARLGEFEDTDDEDALRAYSRGRVNVVNPRTPGGRIARSMDIDRNFMFNAETNRNLTGEPSSSQHGV